MMSDAKSDEKQDKLAAAAHAKAIMAKMDKNRDGAIAMDEFVAACLKDEKLHAMLSATF